MSLPEASEPPEASVVERAAAGDHRAWAELYRRYSSLVFTVVNRVLRDPHLAEDLSQRAWARAFEKVHLYSYRSTFKAWLCKLALNEALGEARKRRPDEVILDDYRQTAGKSVRETLVDRIWLDRAIRRLPWGYRAVIVLRQYGMTDDEIAEILEVKAVTVRTQYRKAKLALREMAVSGWVREGGDHED